jgi:O-antigen ligase
MSIGVLLYILGGSGVVYSVALMGATSIVLIWLAIVTLWALYINVVLGPVWRVLLILMVFGAAAWFVANVLDDFLLLTRFQAVETEGLFISSVTSRLDLLPTFNKQFAISPVFGHSYAEMLAGYERGDYVHSVPLSLLSHAGVVGFAFFALMFIALIAKQPTLATSATSAIKQSEKMKRRVFTLVFLIGCAVAFFSWLPLWFMMGYLMVVEPAYSRGLVGHEQN